MKDLRKSRFFTAKNRLWTECLESRRDRPCNARAR